MNETTTLSADTVKARKAEVDAIGERMDRNPEQASKEDAARFRELVLSTPELWAGALNVITLSKPVQTQIAHSLCMAGSPSDVYLQTGIAVQKKLLCYDEAPAVEKILIDQIITARLRVLAAETRYTANLAKEGISIRVLEHLERAVSSANSNLRRTIETLAKVQRLKAHVPAFQININDGGQQMNVQGSVASKMP